MNLYHLHVKGIKGVRDDKWKEKKEIIITDGFVNRLGKKVNNFNDSVITDELKGIITNINFYLQLDGFEGFLKMPLYLILDYMNDNKVDYETQKIILQEVRNLAFQAAMFKREMAMENFRKDNNSSLPSRQHCLYATTDAGINYWLEQLKDGDIDIFRIEPIEEPFKTSEIFIPSESNNYEEIYNNSFRYWNPKFKNIPEEYSEYLVKGKVKILEKVGEIKRNMNS